MVNAVGKGFVYYPQHSLVALPHRRMSVVVLCTKRKQAFHLDILISCGFSTVLGRGTQIWRNRLLPTRLASLSYAFCWSFWGGRHMYDWSYGQRIDHDKSKGIIDTAEVLRWMFMWKWWSTGKTRRKQLCWLIILGSLEFTSIQRWNSFLNIGLSNEDCRRIPLLIFKLHLITTRCNQRFCYVPRPKLPKPFPLEAPAKPTPFSMKQPTEHQT